MSKTFFIDLTKCTACRGCQVACKQWKNLPAEATRNMGSHQNPQDMSFNTLKLVRFKEEVVDGDLKWLFFPDQCRHCIQPPCKMVGDMDNTEAILHDEVTGAVVFTKATKKIVDFDQVKDACPYNIPRKDTKSKAMAKCDMCIDRVQNGLLPACVQSCPTGAMNFGDREAMLALAEKTLAQVKKIRPKAVLVDKDTVRVIYLAEYAPAAYYQFMMADISPASTMTRQEMFAKVASPFKALFT